MLFNSSCYSRAYLFYHVLCIKKRFDLALSLKAFNILTWLQGSSTDKNHLGCFSILSVGLYSGRPMSLLNYHHLKRNTLLGLFYLSCSVVCIFLCLDLPHPHVICYGAARWTQRARRWQVVFVQLLLRCGLKKLKRAPLLFLGWVFSLERVHERCVSSSR